MSKKEKEAFNKSAKELLENSCKNIKETKKELHYATDAKTVRLLVKKGVDVNAADVGGYTALHLAVREKRLETVKELIRSGADVNAEEYENKCTPLHLACMVGCDPKVVILWWLKSIFPRHQG